MSKGLRANRPESFFCGSAKIRGKSGGKIGLALSLHCWSGGCCDRTISASQVVRRLAMAWLETAPSGQYHIAFRLENQEFKRPLKTHNRRQSGFPRPNRNLRSRHGRRWNVRSRVVDCQRRQRPSDCPNGNESQRLGNSQLTVARGVRSCLRSRVRRRCLRGYSRKRKPEAQRVIRASGTTCAEAIVDPREERRRDHRGSQNRTCTLTSWCSKQEEVNHGNHGKSD